jgi:hypothetical protein
MFNHDLPDADLLKTVLEPLLEDFQYWFERSQSLLQTQEIKFLGDEAQADLLARIKQARQEVSAAQSLINATGGQIGVEASALMPWHRLVTECWHIATQFRLEQSADQESGFKNS